MTIMIWWWHFIMMMITGLIMDRCQRGVLEESKQWRANTKLGIYVSRGISHQASLTRFINARLKLHQMNNTNIYFSTQSHTWYLSFVLHNRNLKKKIHLNVRKFETNCLPTSCFTAYFCVPFGKFYAWLNWFTHPAVVMFVTNISDVEGM